MRGKIDRARRRACLFRKMIHFSALFWFDPRFSTPVVLQEADRLRGRAINQPGYGAANVAGLLQRPARGGGCARTAARVRRRCKRRICARLRTSPDRAMNQPDNGAANVAGLLQRPARGGGCSRTAARVRRQCRRRVCAGLRTSQGSGDESARQRRGERSRPALATGPRNRRLAKRRRPLHKQRDGIGNERHPPHAPKSVTLL